MCSVWAGEIISNRCRYLYERERCHEALPLVELALESIQNNTGLEYARGINLRGLLFLDTNHPKKALDCFMRALEIRRRLLSEDDPFVASGCSNVSLAYTELREFKIAADYQQEAMDIRLKINSPMIGNSYSNMSSILLGTGRPDDAEAMLMRC